jgi:quercetin dioxygenase-like cupin family protein
MTRLFALLLPLALSAQEVKVVRFADSIPFTMGEVTSRRIIHPGLGAKKTTLNLSISQPGAEFAQHVHDSSTDTILVLDGEVNLKQGGSLHLFNGTVTAGKGDAVMISFQNPPDLVLYTGARDSKKTGAAPKGVITPGAVKFVDFRSRNGEFTNAKLGSDRATGFHRKLSKGESFRAKVANTGEGLFFVWKGAIRVKQGSNVYTAGERDTIFVTGPAELEVAGDFAGKTELIQVDAP